MQTATRSNTVGKKMPKTNIFHIRISTHIEKLDIRDPTFLKILQQEYATKYLESLGVEPTVKNINKILKQNPLQNCQILQSRLNGGLHTDTITIITKKDNIYNEKNAKTQDNVSNQMLKILDLKKLGTFGNSQNEKEKGKTYIKNNKDKNGEDILNQGLQYISFDIKEIQEIYIFPFNQNFKRLNNFKLKDVLNFVQEDTDESGILFQSKIFKFPFTQVKLTLNTLKQLQTPISTKLYEIEEFLKKFSKLFPSEVFPVLQTAKPQDVNLNTENIGKFSHIIFQKRNIDKMFSILKMQQNAKFIGIFLHFSYWIIFGAVNPIPIELKMKEKMYFVMFQYMEYFERKVQNTKLWQGLVKPMILLTLKMATHYFFTKLYKKLFLGEDSRKYEAHELAMDKVLFLIEKIFDQGNIDGRFVFLESDIDGPKGNFIKDKKFIRKRIFGTSPALAILLPNPKDGKTRSIIAKNNQIEINNGTIADVGKIMKKSQTDKDCREKLLDLALRKIQKRNEATFKSDNNPIIRLKDE